MVNFNDVALDVSTGHVKIYKPDKVQIDPSEIVWQDEEYEGFRIIKNKEGRFNYIDRSNFLLSPNQDFTSCARFHGEFAVINIAGKGANFLSRKGKYLSKQWFLSAKSFQNGYGVVEVKGKGETFIDKTGKLPFPNQYFKECYGFNNGLARVYRNGKGNFINENGEIISKIWFEECRDYSGGIAAVYNHFRWCYLDKKGNIISPFGFDECLDWENGTGIICHHIHWSDSIFYEVKKYYNMITTNGEYLFEEKILDIQRVVKNRFFVHVEKKGWNISDNKGKFLSPEYFDKIDMFFNEGFCRVYNGSQCNYINFRGKLLSKLWFDSCSPFIEDKNGKIYGRVRIDDAKFRIDAKGNLSPY